jgi:thermitase
MRTPALFVSLLFAAAGFATPSLADKPVPALAARQLVIALASPHATAAGAGAASRAERDAARAALEARVASRLAALSLTRVATLADAVAWDGAERVRPMAAARGADATDDVASNPFTLDAARVMLVEAPDDATAARALSALGTDTDVEWVEPNRVRSIQGWIVDPAGVASVPARVTHGTSLPIPPFPNDPLFRNGFQYGLFNVGPAGLFHGVARADVHATEAWNVTRGSNDVILAIADTGIDPQHPDLAGLMPDGRPRLLAPVNITGLEPASAFADSFGHGTPVTGVMAARTNNGASVDTLGAAGVCGGDGATNAGCRIVAIKIAPEHEGDATSFDIAHALLYATAEGARAMNLSFAGTSPSRVERLALYEAITHGCVLVGAAGNSANALAQYPSAYAANGLCIEVGASDWNDERAAFSSFGPGLDLVAPGLNIYTTFMTYPSSAGAKYDGYVPASGTSLAAPFVAGAVGLLAAARPELVENDFQHLLRESADDIGAPGVDTLTGWGRLNLGRALAGIDPSYGIWHDEAAGSLGAVVATDTLHVGESGPGVMDVARVWPNAQQVEVTATVALPDSFLAPVRVWPRVGGTFTVQGGFQLPYFAPWAEVIANDGRTFTLRGYIYHRTDACADCDEYLPLPADQARFGFTVIGRVDRAPTLSIISPAGPVTVSPGDTMRVVFSAFDPDTLTSIRVWLDSDRTASLLLATLDGGARTAAVVIPCLGTSDTPASLRIEARDDHGPHIDRSEASVSVRVRAGTCQAPPVLALGVSPNPVRGAARIVGNAGAEVTIVDIAGRRVRSATLDRTSGAWTWDGLDARGQRVPAGIYFVRMPGAGRVLERKIVRIE